MQHKFYAKSQKQQDQIQILIAAGALMVIVISFIISWLISFYLLGILTVTIVLSIIAPFIDVPSLKKSGKLEYHSLLFLTEKEKDGVIKIHGGTLFDYVFVIDRRLTGKQRTNFIIQQYVEGLLNLIDKHRNRSTDELTFRGTSYIINEKTAQRMGFDLATTDNLQKLILLYNFFNITTCNSIAKGKLSFPNINATKTFETTLEELLKREDYLKDLNKRLKASLAHKKIKQPLSNT